MTWEIGQPIYVVYDEDTRRFRAVETVITRIGRKKGYYAEHGHEMSFYLEDGSIDGKQYSSPGTVWQSKRDYEAARGIADAWSYVRQRLPYRAPNKMDLYSVQLIASLLEIEIPKALLEQSK